MDRLPNLVIIGAQKAGTTSLSYYLSLHPEIFMFRQHEPNFFNQELNWRKGLAWYKSKFPAKPDVKVYGESSPAYTRFPEFRGVPQRMHQIIPKAKLIYIIRNPVDRLISQYTDRVRGGVESRTFAEILDNELLGGGDNVYIWFSKYYIQLEQFLKYYPREQILLLRTSDLKEKRRKILGRVFNFLGVDENFNCEQFLQEKNISKIKRKQKNFKSPRYYFLRKYQKGKLSGKLINALTFNFIKNKIKQINSQQEKVDKPVLTKTEYDKLMDIFKPDIEKLSQFSGYDFSDWFEFRVSGE